MHMNSWSIEWPQFVHGNTGQMTFKLSIWSIWCWNSFFKSYDEIYELTKLWDLTKSNIFKDYFMRVSTYFYHFDIAPITSGKVYYNEESDELLPSLNHGVICKFGCMRLIHSSFLVSILYIFLYWFVQIDFILNYVLWNHPNATQSSYSLLCGNKMVCFGFAF